MTPEREAELRAHAKRPEDYEWGVRHVHELLDALDAERRAREEAEGLINEIRDDAERRMRFRAEELDAARAEAARLREAVEKDAETHHKLGGCMTCMAIQSDIIAEARREAFREASALCRDTERFYGEYHAKRIEALSPPPPGGGEAGVFVPRRVLDELGKVDMTVDYGEDEEPAPDGGEEGEG